MKETGQLIVLEGIDGVGKTTQIELIKKNYEDLVHFKYPTREYSILNDYLEKKISIESKSLFLLFLADIAHEQEKLRNALLENRYVVLDRYVFSTISYEINGISYENGKKIIESIDYIKPSKIILLDADPKLLQDRKRKQKELDRYEENLLYLNKVRSNFLKLFEERFLTPNWHKIDASKPIDTVQSEIMKLF